MIEVGKFMHRQLNIEICFLMASNKVFGNLYMFSIGQTVDCSVFMHIFSLNVKY